MITAITGILEASGSDWVVIAVGGVSLRVQVPASALESLGPPGSQVRLATHLQVTEDTLLLYGFPQAEALRLFQMLLGVAGVGPRAGLSVLSAMATDEVAAAIASGDVKALSRAPGLAGRPPAVLSWSFGARSSRSGWSRRALAPHQMVRSWRL